MDEIARAKKEAVLIFERIEQMLDEGTAFSCIENAKLAAIRDLHAFGKIHTKTYTHNCPFCEMWRMDSSCQECLWPTYCEDQEEFQCEDHRSPYSAIAYNVGKELAIADIRKVIELLKSL